MREDGSVRFIAGLAVGLGVGLVAASGLRAPAPEPRSSVAARLDPAPAVPAAVAPAPAPPQTSGACDARGPLIVRYPGGGVVALDNVVIIDGGEVIGCAPRTLTEIRRALADARAAEDWAAYYAALSELGTAGTREAEQVLVEVMGDESLRLEGYRTGKSFCGWLAESDVPGIVDAARRRAAIDIEDEPDDSRWRGIGWLALVALRGGEADLSWLESLGRGQRNTEMDVDRALAEGSANPLAVERLARRMRDPGGFRWSERFHSFAAEHPQAVLDAALEALPAVAEADDLLRMIAEATTPDTVDRTRAALLGLRLPDARLAALKAVGRMRDRGIDVSGFADLVDEPRLLLERSMSRPLDRGEAREVRNAIRAIGENPVTWGEAATGALRGFLEHEDTDVADAAKKALGRIGTGPEKGRAWKPERRPTGR